MSMREGLASLLRWTPSSVLPPLAALAPEDFDQALKALVKRFDAALAVAASGQIEDEAALRRLERARSKMQNVGAILGAMASFDRDKFDPAWNRWHAGEQKAIFRARSSRPLRALLMRLSHQDQPAGKAEALARSSFWGREAYEPKRKGAERRALSERETRLTEKFKANARAEARRTWIHVEKEDGDKIARVPVAVKRRAQARAASQGESGWLFAAEFSAYGPFMYFCSDRKMRETMYKTRSRLASEWGHKERDNTQLGLEILHLRAQQAKAAGKSSYAEHCMSGNMLSTPKAAENFLLGLASTAAERAKNERKEALEWMKKTEGVRAMQPWDWRRAFHGLREERGGPSQEESMAHFPVMETVERCCALVASFLGAKSERNGAAEAQSGATFIAEWTREGASEPFARLWIEPWASAKRSLVYAMHWSIAEPRAGVGGWSFVSLQQDPKLPGMKHTDVSTLLHELGHAAHAMGPVSRWGEKSASFTEADGVEFYSQFFERLVWDKQILDFLSQSPDGFPTELLARLCKHKTVAVASEQLAGIAESLTDLRVHGRSAKKRARLWDVFNLARQEVGLAAARSYKRFFHTSFAMTTDYSCADYSYAWTNSLAAQAFKRWQADRDEKGGQKAAERFNASILRPGSSTALQTLIADYCGEGPVMGAWIEEVEQIERMGEGEE